MIDLTPLDVRNKRGDFKRGLRGYEPQEVDVFLELVAERLEVLVRENLQLRERSDTLAQQVSSQTGREQAVQEALVTAQELRSDITGQARREADMILREAETEARRLIAEAEAEVRKQIRDAERRLEQGQDALAEMERRRTRFLKAFRQLLERELDVVEVEEERAPLEDRPIDLDLGKGLFSEPAPEASNIDEFLEGAPEAAEESASAGAAATGGTTPPPLDAPVDELAAAYLDDGEPQQSEEETLSFPFEPDKPEDKGWG